MIVKVKYTEYSYEYEIPLSKLLPFLKVTECEIEEACKKAIIKI